MAAPFNYQELAERYGLEPLSESVLQLSRLVARQEADLDEMAWIVSQDAALARRLIRAADPRAKNETECGMDVVRASLTCTGIRCVLLLAMSVPLAFALAKTFHTMLGAELVKIPFDASQPIAGEHLLCTIGFSGKAEGNVILRLSPDSARRAATAILRVKSEKITRDAEINDAIGELLNMVAGNLNSNLCDAGLDCQLHTPMVGRARTFEIEMVPGGGWERAVFHAPGILLFVDLTVNPWGGK